MQSLFRLWMRSQTVTAEWELRETSGSQCEKLDQKTPKNSYSKTRISKRRPQCRIRHCNDAALAESV